MSAEFPFTGAAVADASTELEVFREFETARYLVFGIAMILTMILRPRGIWPVQFGNIPQFLKKDVK